jgi:hypothetical protein
MSITIYAKHNWTRKDIHYIKNTRITEYDMSNAGINILLTKGLLKPDFVNHLNKMDKLQKNITVGKILQKNPEWNKIMMEEFVAIRKYFMEVNNLDDSDILSIKKDAIFVIDKKVRHLKLSANYEFKEKNTYDTYLNIMNKEFYVNIEKELYDTKGFSDLVLKYQEDYFIDFIITTLVLDRSSEREKFEHIKEFRTKFLTFQLEPNFYFDLLDGGYIYKYNKNSTVPLISTVEPEDLSVCDITNNYKFLFELIQIIL